VGLRWLEFGQVLFRLFTDQDGLDVHKHAKKEQGQYPAILTKQAWSVKELF